MDHVELPLTRSIIGPVKWEREKVSLWNPTLRGGELHQAGLCMPPSTKSTCITSVPILEMSFLTQMMGHFFYEVRTIECIGELCPHLTFKQKVPKPHRLLEWLNNNCLFLTICQNNHFCSVTFFFTMFLIILICFHYIFSFCSIRYCRYKLANQIPW